MSTELITTTINNSALSVEDMRAQVHQIQGYMAGIMKDGEHYGAIPGCGDKKTLLKPGAEKLCFAFQFSPSFATEVVDMGKGHREYRVECTLTHRPTGTFVASSHGSCNTMESRYRYRTEATGKPVPQEYWTSRDPQLLGGSQFKPRKADGKWVIMQQAEHDNPADYYNTCLKMAAKRAHVAATLAALAASDIFTQDVEDTPELYRQAAAKKEAPADNLENGGVRETVERTEKPANGNGGTEKQRKYLYVILKKQGLDTDIASELVTELYNGRYGDAIEALKQQGHIPERVQDWLQRREGDFSTVETSDSLEHDEIGF